jgi:hypothetical protein
MRLLHTTDFKLYTFHGRIPPYIILSHTWEEDEYTFQDHQTGQNQDSAGWQKVSKFCDLASRAGYRYVWIDTCCIDKSSSAELQEAINSMYHYYRRSRLCIVYLADVMDKCRYEGDGFEAAFRASKWFTRGWTLQELFTPSSVYFWSNTWTEQLGTKVTLRNLIMSVTGISLDALSDFKRNDYYAASVLHWASRRVCTREEDEAYSLLGLLNISMPLLYGEGSKAFVRLQQEIATTSDDESILAWTTHYSYGVNVELQAVLNNIVQEHLFAPFVKCFRTPARRIDGGSQSQRVFTCTNDRCGKSFSSDANLKLHSTGRICYDGEPELPRPFIMGPQGLYVRRRIYLVHETKQPRHEIRQKILLFFRHIERVAR